MQNEPYLLPFSVSNPDAQSHVILTNCWCIKPLYVKEYNLVHVKCQYLTSWVWEQARTYYAHAYIRTTLGCFCTSFLSMNFLFIYQFNIYTGASSLVNTRNDCKWGQCMGLWLIQEKKKRYILKKSGFFKTLNNTPDAVMLPTQYVMRTAHSVPFHPCGISPKHRWSHLSVGDLSITIALCLARFRLLTSCWSGFDERNVPIAPVLKRKEGERKKKKKRGWEKD